MGEREGQTIEGSTRPSTDRELLGRLCARDSTAFALLYDRHARRVFGRALRPLGDPAAAEAATGAAFLALWHRAADADPPRGDVRGWLRATVERDATRDTAARAAAGTAGA